MKVIGYLIIVAAALLLPAYALASDPARVTLVQGEARLYPEGADTWSDLSANMPILEGDRIGALQGGRVEVSLAGGTRVRLDGGASVTVLRLEDGKAGLYLERGRLFVNARAGSGGEVSVETPRAYITDAQGSVFMADVSVDGITDVSVLEGNVRAEGGGVAVAVGTGEAFHVRGERRAEVTALGPRGEWEEWNLGRDRALARSYESERYLPPELHAYAPEFDAHGSWIYVSDYGRVWRPSLSITVGWAPYRHGRWLFIGGDYVWISDEPWGWAPYHYGRWAYLPRAGWCWVPPRHRDVHWGPGFVAWVGSGTYIGWVPLAPGEPFIGHRYYGPGSVNIVDIDIHKTIIYKNARVKDAVTVIHKDRFREGRKPDFRAKHNPFLDKKVSYGPPPLPDRHRSKDHKDARVDRPKADRPVAKGPYQGKGPGDGRDYRRPDTPPSAYKPGAAAPDERRRSVAVPDSIRKSSEYQGAERVRDRQRYDVRTSVEARKTGSGAVARQGQTVTRPPEAKTGTGRELSRPDPRADRRYERVASPQRSYSRPEPAHSRNLSGNARAEAKALPKARDPKPLVQQARPPGDGKREVRAKGNSGDTRDKAQAQERLAREDGRPGNPGQLRMEERARGRGMMR
ncbi:MAG: FecR domain-containing protein [Thermodesulfovibrionales bacterium]